MITATEIRAQDTLLRLQEVYVNDFAEKNISIKELKNDSTFSLVNAQINISEQLSALGNGIFIKNYGTGLASISLRGASASHTQVFWNDIPVQSPMLGQLDLSLLPAFLADNVVLLHGNASMEKGSGGFGGAIELKNRLPEHIFHEKVYFSYGSFQNVKTANDFFLKNKKIAFRNRFFWEFAENNFPFRFQGENRKQMHAQNRKIGQLSEIFFQKSPKVSLTFRLWTQKNARNLPPPMTSRQAQDRQNDESERLSLDYFFFDEKKTFRTQIALMRERLLFENPTAQIFSDSKILTGFHRCELTRVYGQTDFSFILQNAYYKAFTNSYEEKNERFQNVFFFKINRESTHFYTTWQVRVEGINFENLLLLPSVSIRAKISEKLISETQIGLNGRFPTMNDLFWQPGGNPNLKAERAWQAQEALLWTIFRSESEKLALKTVYFEQIINNRIQWIPAFAGFWQPVNLKTVRSNGFEISAEGEKKFINARLYAQFQYALTKSRSIKTDFFEDKSLNKQLIYTPLHNFKANVSVEKNSYGARFDSQAYSRRFTDADNNFWLLPYFIADISIWKKITRKNFSLTVIFQCKNVGNVMYQSMAFYALPGRNWQFSLVAELKK